MTLNTNRQPGDTIESGDINLIASRVNHAVSAADAAYEYNQALVAPAASVINAVVTDPNTESGALVAAKVDKNAEVVNVMDHGAAADGVTDDSAALIAARDAAIGGRAASQGSMPLMVPAGMTLYVNTVVDLRYIIDLRIEGRVNVGPSGLLIIGHTSSQKPGQRVHIRQAMHATAGQTNPCVRIVGMKQAQVTVLRCDHMELLADSRTNNTTDGSISYNEITLGRIDKLHLRGEGDGWITENQFHGGDIKALVVSGSYGHNQNRWEKPCFEGGSIDFQTGTRNLMLDARCEAGTTVSFGPSTSRNVLVDNFVSNGVVRNPGAKVIEDAGRDNVVMGTPDAYLTATPLVHIDAASTILDGCRDTAGDPLTPGLDKIVPSAWKWVIDTGIVPIREEVTGYGNGTYEGSWAMTRFEIHSDAKWWRPNFQFFDASGSPVTSPSSILGSGWEYVNEYWTQQTDLDAAHIVVNDKRITHARIRVRVGGSPVPFRFLRLTGFTLAPGVTTGADRIRRQTRRPLYQTTKPTKGVAHPGTRVEGPNGGWVATARADTTAMGSAAGTTSAVRVASTAGMAAGDVIGFVLSDGTTHWTTITNVGAETVALTTALPLGVPAGSPVVTTRWTP